MEENYETQSLYEAAYLLTKGCSLAGKRSDGQKVTLMFSGHSKVQMEVLNFYNNGKVEAKRLFDCYRTLKDYIFQK